MTNQPLKILFIEDCEDDCTLVEHYLNQHGLPCKITRVENRTALEAAMAKNSFDVVLADCALPNFGGMPALHLVRNLEPEIPFIIVSGTIGEETAVDFLRNGATDYILKDRLTRLAPAIRRALEECEERGRNEELEQRLRQAQQLEAVGTLAGGVAHDFNNILTIILGHAALLKLPGNSASRVFEISTTIEQASHRGAELIRQLLAFARKSDGRFTTLQINSRVEETVVLLREALPRNIHFQLDLQNDLPLIQADPTQIDRVLINLVTNARDAMPTGGEITLATRLATPEETAVQAPNSSRKYICLQVRDTGTGIDETTRRHIFEPFYTTKTRGRGTGLGLPVVYGLMQSHDGMVDLRSEVGKGTVVSLFFPQSQDDHETHAAAPDSGPPGTGTETILVVEDEPAVRYFIQVVFEMNGYTVLLAHDAEEALDLFAAHAAEVDLVFTDIGLPEMDGFTLCSQLREQKPGLTTMVASGNTEGTFKTKIAQLRIDGFLLKPYDSFQLLVTVREILDKR